MIYFRIPLFILFSISCSFSQTFQEFINRINAAQYDERTAIVDSFMTAHPQLPFYENDTTVHFIYRGTATSVSVPGDASSWSSTGYNMTKPSSTDLWYLTKKFEADARLDYKFVLNGSNWIADPRNPNRAPGGYGNSELRMPLYSLPPEIQYYADIPHGTLRDTLFRSSILNNSRTVKVYLPPNYESSTDSFPVILFHDGLEYVSFAYANRVIDYLLSNNRIQPVIAVFVPPVNRTPEYAGNQITQFSSFIVTELMPYIDSRYRTRKSPASRAVLGASYGGNISLYLAFNFPEVFGNTAPQSSYISSSLSSGFRDSAMLDLKLYLDLGTYDIDVLIPMVRNFIPILQSKGYDYRYKEYHEGHSWGNWRAHIDDALEFFFPGPALEISETPEIPEKAVLFQNYPNPFNPATNFGFRIPARPAGGANFEFVTLSVFDLLGRKVDMLLKEQKPAGEYSVHWDASRFPGGVYFYQLQTESSTFTRRMILIK
ncbi:MAG: T9SS type A sorting domain-containing protein [Ignavibacteriae bacterium]|nr:T9SS type A sorting domain-containing protein [Ignavibacteriota bacterium]